MRPVNSISMVLILLAAALSDAPAQNTAKAMKEPLPGIVRFSVTGEIPPSAGYFRDGPTGILDRLIKYPALRSVDLDRNNEERYRLRARFLFSGLEEFKNWYDTEEVRTLLNNLESINTGEYSVEIDVHRASVVRSE